MEFKIIAIFLASVFPFLLSAVPAAAQNAEDVLASGARDSETIMLHYHRPDDDYKNWNIWSWAENSGNLKAELNHAGSDDFGVFYKVDLSVYGGAARIGFLPKYKEWEQKDDPNRFLDINDIRGAAGGFKKDIYIVSGRKEIFYEIPDVRPFIKNAFLDSKFDITVVLSKKINKVRHDAFSISMKNPAGGVKNINVASAVLIGDNGEELKEHSGGARSSEVFVSQAGGGLISSNIVRLRLAEAILYDFSGVPPEAGVYFEGFEPAKLRMRNILYSEDFHYDGELGYFYTKNSCIFRVFSPAASSAEVVIYDAHDTSHGRAYSMKKERSGVWAAFISGDLLNKYYKYRVIIDEEPHEALDPYSKCNTAHNGRAMIINDKTPVADPPVFTIDKAIIYEMHIRDFTIDEKTAVSHRGKFLGAAWQNAFFSGDPSVKTGIGHLKELGVNTVQILPFQDFENDEASQDYNWGYMPVNFNSPDGWYASRTFDSSRVIECKKMIDSFHRNGIKVVMDVVYNHTAEGGEQVRYSFNALAPGYYYRTKIDGSYWNGSGCGNEFKSESYMGRKFIIDSLKYWVKEYKIDGFRFDLMGLIDTQTVYLLTDELKKINPDIFIYGEPWAAGMSGIEPTVKGAQRGKGFAVFNDIFRDAIKGSVWDDKGGYVQGTSGVEIIEHGVTGSILDFAASPLESINYCEAHDNRTLYDTLIHTTSRDRSITAEKIKRMHRLACFLILTSQGVVFIHSGQEMMRTKNGEENSYNKPDSINKINWELKIENKDVIELFKNFIAMRLEHPLFRLTSAEDVFSCVKFLSHDLKMPVAPKCLAYILERKSTGDKWKAALVLANPRRDTVKFIIPEGEWNIFYHNDKFFTDESAGGASLKITSEIELKPISGALLYMR